MLLCSLCFFNSKHDKEHHIINIDNQNSLENNDISIDKSISEFDEIFSKVKALKLKLEEEIDKLNNTYENNENELTIYFKKQHFSLEEQERKMRTELKFKVTEIKEELEEFLRKSKIILLNCEKTQKIVENYKVKNEHNKLKTLNYISEINKNKDISIKFLKNKMKIIKVSSSLFSPPFKYEYEYINGVPIPKDIKAEKKGKQLYISWEIDDFALKYFELENIKFSLSISYYINNNSLFGTPPSIYETTNKYFYYENYNENADCEIKVKTLMDGCYSNWYEIKIPKSANITPISLFSLNNNNNQSNSVINSNNSPFIGLFSFNNNNNDNKITTGLFGQSLFSSTNNFSNTNDKKSDLINNNNNKKEENFKINDNKSNAFVNNNLFAQNNNKNAESVEKINDIIGK